MIDPIIIDFTTRGIPEVGRAFDTVEQRIARFEKQAAAQAQKGGKERVRTAEGEAKAREAAYKKLVNETTRADKQQTREFESETRRRDGIVRRSSEMAGRYAQQQAKIEERAAQETTRTVEREAERRMRIQIRSSEMAGRAAAKAAAEEARAAEIAGNARARAGRRIGSTIFGSVGSTLSGMGTMATATLGIGGGMLLADAGRREMSFERIAAQLVNAGTTNGVAPGTISDVRTAALKESLKSGMSKEDLAGAALSYAHSAKGGDFKGALENMGFFAQIARVTGSDINELASSAGILQSQNPNLDSGKMQQLMLDVVAQTHAGSLSMPEVAKMAGELGSTRSSFLGDEMVNQRKLIGLSQLARSEVASPEEAGTAIKDFSLEAGKHRKSTAGKIGLEQMGVQFNKDASKGVLGAMSSPEQAIDAIFRYTKGDVTKIEDALGSQRATPIFRALAGIYSKSGGGEAGMSAINAEMGKMTGATMSQEQMNVSDKLALDQPAEKFKIALNSITESVEEKLAPRLADFADNTLPKLLPVIDSIVEKGGALASWFVENPIMGIGSIIIASVAKDVASAEIGNAIKAMMQGAFRGMGGPAGASPLGADVGAATGLARAGTGVLTGLKGAAVGTGALTMITTAFEGGPKVGSSYGKTTAAANDPTKGAFWQSLPGAFVKKAHEIAEHPLDFLMTDPGQTKATPSPGGAPGGPAGSDSMRASATALKGTTAAAEQLNKQLAITTAQLAALGNGASNVHPEAPQRNGPR